MDNMLSIWELNRSFPGLLDEMNELLDRFEAVAERIGTRVFPGGGDYEVRYERPDRSEGVRVMIKNNDIV